MLGHPVRVRSQAGKGSVFSIEVATSVSDATLPSETSRDSLTEEAIETTGQTGAILVVEDDPAIRDLIEILLNQAGHKVATALDGPAALDVVARGFRPDLLLTDYNLPRGLSGIELASRLRDKIHRQIPVIILTGDISTDVLHLIASAKCAQMNKPVRAEELGSVIDRLLMSRPAVPAMSITPRGQNGAAAVPTIFVIDDAADIRSAFRDVLTQEGLAVETFSTCEDFIRSYAQGRKGCLVIDAYLPGMNGLELCCAGSVNPAIVSPPS